MYKIKVQKIKLANLITLLLFLNILLVYGLIDITQQFYSAYNAYSAQEEYVDELYTREAILESGISELDSPFAVERMAKSRLNLKLPKENVVIISEIEGSKKSQSDGANQAVSAGDVISEPLKTADLMDLLSTALFYVYNYIIDHIK